MEADAGLHSRSCLDRWKRGYVLAAMGLARGGKLSNTSEGVNGMTCMVEFV